MLHHPTTTTPLTLGTTTLLLPIVRGVVVVGDGAYSSGSAEKVAF